MKDIYLADIVGDLEFEIIAEDVGEFATSCWYKTDGTIPEISRRVYQELAGHVEEGLRDGKYDFIYLGAHTDYRKAMYILGNVISHVISQTGDDELRLKAAISCAYSKNGKIHVISITAYYKGKEERGLIRISLKLPGETIPSNKDLLRDMQHLTQLLRTEVSKAGNYLFNNIEFDSKAET